MSRCCLVSGASKSLKRLVQLTHRGIRESLDELSDPPEYIVARRAVFLQVAPAFVGHLVNLLTALFGDDLRIAQIFEHGEGGVDRARARSVRPSEAALEVLD